MLSRLLSAFLGAIVLSAVLAVPAQAERVRFRYPLADITGTVVQTPGVPHATPGERIADLGAVREPASCRLRPTHMVTFYHPAVNRNVTVPMALPYDNTPRTEHRGNRLIFNYGSYTVETLFLDDGSVEVVYNSGPGRPLGWCFRP
jgi:hypothetical protein